MRDRKKVSHDEFNKFLSKYNNRKKLNVNMNYINEPPVMEWIDFSNGKSWPACVVCFKYCNKNYGKEDDYYIFCEHLGAQGGDGN